jgi:hypothetical protein
MAKKRLLLDYPIQTFEQISVAKTAVGVTSANIKKGGALIQNIGANVRWRADGTDPTAIVGHILYDGAEIRIAHNTSLSRFRAIRAGQKDSQLSVSHMG